MLAELMFLLALGAVVTWLWRRYTASCEADRLAEFCAAAERGEWVRVPTGNWKDWQYEQSRTVTWAHLKPGRPANWWDSAEWAEWVETRPYPPGYSPFLERASGMRAELPRPVPAPQPGTTQQLPIWSPGTVYDPSAYAPVPGVPPGMTSYPTAAQVYMLNTQGATAVNAANNGANVR